MMRKTSALFGVAALLFALLLGQTSSGQMPMGPTAQPQLQLNPQDPQAFQHEIHLLMAINRMGLTLQQLQQLQQILAELRAPQMAQMQRQRELRGFLLSWQGTPEEFEEALKAFQEQTQQNQEQLQQQRRQAIERLKDVLTYRQGELLRQALHKLSAGTEQMDVRMGMMAQMRERMGQMGPMCGQGLPQQDMMGQMHQQPMRQTQPMMQMMPQMGGHGQMGRMGQRAPRRPAQQPMRPMMQHMQHMMPQMGGMGMGQAPTFDELVLKHVELLERVISAKLQALQQQQ
jgi:hypothetical protein